MITKRRLWMGAGLLAIAVLTVAVRFFAIHMYDVHIDEITYARFAQTIDAGQLPRDYDGSPFFLHPPGYFALLAIWRAMLWHGGSMFAQFTILRTLNIVLAGFSALLVALLAKRFTSSYKLGLLAGALFAIDPFLIRQNARGMMETATMLLLLSGLALLLRNIHKPATARWTWLGIGFVFGLAIVTKDVALNFMVLAFALMALRKVGPEWRAFKFIIPAALTPYAIWVAIVGFSGYLSDFISQKTAGIQRFFGLVQTTGFNAVNAPSKSGTLLQTIPHYATSYALMGLGAVAAFGLLFSKDEDRRRWGCIGTAASLLLAYLYVGGTFEEQYLYYLMVPSIISVVVGAIELWRIIPTTYHRLMHGIAIATIVSVMGFGAISYAMQVPKQANGWQKTISWVDSNVPRDSPICVFGQGQFLLNGFNVCAWDSYSSMKSHHVQYLIISEKVTGANYGPFSPSEYAKVKKASTVAFRYDSPDSGVFDVLKLNQSVPDVAPSKPNVASVTPTPTKVATIQPTIITPNPVTAATTLPDTGSTLKPMLTAVGIVTVLGSAIPYIRFYLRNRRMNRGFAAEKPASYQPGTNLTSIVSLSQRSEEDASREPLTW